MSTMLDTRPRLDAPDDFYQALIDAHQGLSNQQSHAFNARLVLLLANYIGSVDVLREALAAAAPAQPDADAGAGDSASPPE